MHERIGIQMAYEPAKDQTVHGVGRITFSERQWIDVSVKKYDGGVKKVAVIRQGTKKSGETWTSKELPRLSKSQAIELAKLLDAAAGQAE